MEWLNHPVVNAVCIIVAMVASVLCGYFGYRLKSQKQQLDYLDKFVKKELAVMSQSHVIMGKRLIGIEGVNTNGEEARANVRPRNEKDDSFDFQEKLHSGSYNSALNLLKQGMSSDDVAKRCGLSKAETSLMQLVNRESPVGH